MQSNRLINWAEKRIKLRHKAPGLRCKLSHTGISGWFKPTKTIECLDFNRYGMAALIASPLRTGTIISLQFKGKYIVQSNVKARVSSCIEQPDGFRVSLVFCYATDTKQYSRKIDNALSRIERIYSQQ